MTQAILSYVRGLRAPEGITSASHAILQTLARRGVRAAFGIPGGLISPIFDALSDVPEMELVTTRHEAVAGFAAMGHFLVTGKPAVVLTTSGPGFTNALTGIAAAFAEEIPLVVIAGEVPRDAASRGALQDASTNALDAVAMVRTITRFSARVEAAAGATGAVEQALRIAMGERPGPVFLSLPLDVGAAQTSTSAPFALPLPEPNVPEPNAEACREIAERLRRARRPLFVLGNGARAAAADVRALAERLSIPVVTTPHAKGLFPESHPLHLGGIGLGAHPSAIAYLEGRPDVVVVIGSRLGDYATNGWSIPVRGSEATIQIDRDPFLIGRNYPVTVGVVADARAAVRKVLAALPLDTARPLREGRGIERIREDKMTSDEVPLQPARVLAALGAAFPGALWTCDQGEHCAYAIHYLEVDEPDQFRTMVGLASMGSGLGITIGAKHALPHRTVIGLCGDGSFAMHAGEVLTCVEAGIAAVFVVFNDGRYNMVHHGFNAVFGRMPNGLPEHVADIAAVAEAFGAVGVRIETPEDLDVETLRGLARIGRPLVLDVRIDPSLSLSASSRSAALRRSAVGAR